MGEVARVLSEREAYEELLTAILHRAVVDYICSSTGVTRAKRLKRRREHERVLCSCRRFFEDPPYDYGDVDLRWVRGWCDDALASGKAKTLALQNNRMRELK